MTRTTLALACLPLLAACSTEAGATGPADRPNVVLICLDTVRADHLGFGGYTARDTTPFLDELAARSVVFADASAAASWTKPSVPSYLTGTPPATHGVYEGSARGLAGVTSDVLGPEALTLAEVFEGAGYRTGAIVQNAQLRAGMGFEQGFGTYVDGAGRADAIRWQGLDWLDAGEAPGSTAGDDPFFLYLHFLDAHWPYPVPDEYATLWADAASIELYRGADSKALRDAIHDGEVPFGAAEREALVALYDGSLRYLDDQLRLLFEGLERRGLAEDTIVALVSDHGEEFGERGRIGHGHGLSEALLRVPFLLHVPGDPDLAGLRFEDPVSLLDLFPTLVHAAGLADALPEGPGTPGIARSLLLDPAAGRPILSEHKAPDRYLHALREGDRKLERSFRPTERELLPPFEVGERYEAELALGADLSAAALVATQIKPRDEDADDPPEVKAPITSLEPAGTDGARRLTLAGLPVLLPPGVVPAPTDDAGDGELAPGRLVKVRGTFEGGLLVAERVKVYARDAEPVVELRATATAATFDRLELGPLAVAVTKGTHLKGLDEDRRKLRMDGADVRAVLTGERGGFALEERLLDLDERELGDAAAVARLRDELERRLGAWASLRSTGGTSQRVLTEAELADLAAIGYTDE